MTRVPASWLAQARIRDRDCGRVVAPATEWRPDWADDVRNVREVETFQPWVVKVAKANGWTTYHTHDPRRSDPGWLDLTLGHLEWGRAEFWELKTERGKLTPEQSRWIQILRQAGHVAECYRPGDWPRIVATLTRKERDEC